VVKIVRRLLLRQLRKYLLFQLPEEKLARQEALNEPYQPQISELTAKVEAFSRIRRQTPDGRTPASPQFEIFTEFTPLFEETSRNKIEFGMAGISKR
jgi:hypothetical protein